MNLAMTLWKKLNHFYILVLSDQRTEILITAADILQLQIISQEKKHRGILLLYFDAFLAKTTTKTHVCCQTPNECSCITLGDMNEA